MFIIALADTINCAYSLSKIYSIVYSALCSLEPLALTLIFEGDKIFHGLESLMSEARVEFHHDTRHAGISR